MAFKQAMAMMGSKGKMPDAVKGKDKQMPHGKVEGEDGDGAGDAMSLHSNGDGSYKTSDGEHHEHLGKALMHMAHHHEPHGKHMHVHHDGFSIKTHGIHESGEHDGPQEHEDVESAKSHVGHFLGGENESTPESDGGEEEPSIGGYGG